MDNKRVCILMRSYAGGGKSYRANELAKEYNAVICSADDFWMKDGQYCFDVTKLKIAHNVCYEKFKNAVLAGNNVIVDNTNLKFEDIKKYLEFIIINNNNNKFYYSADICQVEYNDIETAISYRTGRDDGKNIPKERMYEMYRAFKRTNAIALLDSNYKNKFPFIFERSSIYNNFFENYIDTTSNKQGAVICDLDGTLSLFKMPDGTTLRNAFDASKADEDIINVAVAKTISALELVGNKLIFVSGREDKFREPTMTFLNRVADRYGISKDITLYMRQSGDFRPDDIVKNEIYNTEIADSYDVVAVFDDRPKVVRMWRSIGLMVFDCNYREEDF